MSDRNRGLKVVFDRTGLGVERAHHAPQESLWQKLRLVAIKRHQEWSSSAAHGRWTRLPFSRRLGRSVAKRGVRLTWNGTVDDAGLLSATHGVGP